jgi:alkanesulfonate monooxygenase SsuD/methylene tetrahydromethanopterin reductase-like flavin-dependent oxidoreductase (luciferase family)
MKIGLQLPSFTWPGGPSRIAPYLTRIGPAAEDAGFASLWVMDHFFQIDMVGKYDEPMLEGYSALSYLAAVTRRVRLGTLVTGVIYRYPGILVKTVTVLDVLSGGRAYFGIGAGWYEREAVGLGVPFPQRKERFERLEETLQIAKQMWSGKATPYSGKHYRLAEPLNLLNPSASRTRRFSSAAPERRKLCAWRPVTPMRAICTLSTERMPSAGSSKYFTGTATTSAVRTMRSSARRSEASTWVLMQ